MLTFARGKFLLSITMKAITITLIFGAILCVVQCKKDEKDDKTPLLALLGLPSGSTGTVVCGGAAFCTTFVTPAANDGNLGGTTGADAKCTAAKPAGLTGTFKALIISPGSRTASPAVDWVLAASKEYRREDGTTSIFTTDSSRLPQATLTNTIYALGGSNFFWDGLDAQQWNHAGGASHCSNWTSTGGNGGIGWVTKTPSLATAGNGAFAVDNLPCNSPLRLFCVQQ